MYRKLRKKKKEKFKLTFNQTFIQTEFLVKRSLKIRKILLFIKKLDHEKDKHPHKRNFHVNKILLRVIYT